MVIPEPERNPGSALGVSELPVLSRAMASFPSFCALLKIPPLKTSRDENPGLIPMRLTPIQRAYCARRTSRDIILKPRRVYMTTLEVAYDLWWFFTVRGARVIIVCQTTDDHGVRDELAEMVRVMVESLREHVKIVLDVENNLRLAWHERDARLRIVEAGASLETARVRGRGITVNRLHATELASWRHGIETMNVLLNAMPQDARYGSVTIESTPRGASGYYYERWTQAVEGKGNFTAQFFPWYEHDEYGLALEPGEIVEPTEDEKVLLGKGATLEALKWRRKQVADQGESQIAQEYPSDPATCFLLSGREYFDSASTTKLLGLAERPTRVVPLRGSGIHGELRVYAEPATDEDYVIAADTSEGGGGDLSAAVVREVGSGREVAKLSGQIKPGEFGVVLEEVARAHNDALVVVERNGPGLTTLDRLKNVLGYPRVYESRHDRKPGWHTNGASRPAALAGLEQAQRDGTWSSRDKPTLEQMRVFVWRERPSGSSKAEAAPGEHDDMIMAEAICWDVLRHPVRGPRRDVRNLPPR